METYEIYIWEGPVINEEPFIASARLLGQLMAGREVIRVCESEYAILLDFSDGTRWDCWFRL